MEELLLMRPENKLFPSIQFCILARIKCCRITPSYLDIQDLILLVGSDHLEVVRRRFSFYHTSSTPGYYHQSIQTLEAPFLKTQIQITNRHAAPFTRERRK